MVFEELTRFNMSSATATCWPDTALQVPRLLHSGSLKIDVDGNCIDPLRRFPGGNSGFRVPAS